MLAFVPILASLRTLGFPNELIFPTSLFWHKGVAEERRGPTRALACLPGPRAIAHSTPD
jgi:hypothetical protein